MKNTTSTPLASDWSFMFYKAQGGKSSEKYEENIHHLGTFNTVEGFWNIYSHLKRPNDLEPPTDYHLFRNGIRAIWEDADNINGGKWIIRLKKGLASYYWERLIIALIGEQFPVDALGAVISVRYPEDLISLWNRTASDTNVRHEICRALCSALELPPDTKLEYKEHGDAVKDHSSFRNTVIYQAGTDEPFEIPQKKQGQGNKSGK